MQRPFHRPGVIALVALITTGLGIATAFGTSQSTDVFEGRRLGVIEPLAIQVAPPTAVGSDLLTRELKVQRGESISSLVNQMGLDDAEAVSFLRNAPEAAVISRQLAPGKTIHARITSQGKLESLAFPLNGEKSVAAFVTRSGNGLTVSQVPLETDRRTHLQTAVIKHSLFGAADESGIPDAIATQLADIFGGDIDFHHDLRKGDRFTVVYEAESNQARSTGSHRILAAEFVNEGRIYRAYWYKTTASQGGYYTEEGRSLKKAFLRSPLEFSRITSGFSTARVHPILGETRAHRGIDYGAPTGTRVKTTGDGIVEFAGTQGGYGKVIIVRHAGNRTTVYGHLSGYAANIKKGTRVSQGDIIGYVGATGLATGPHLHYEFQIAGVHRNPLTVALPDAEPLTPAQFTDYKTFIVGLSWQIESLRGFQVAQID